MSFKRQLIYKIYEEDDTFVSVLTDVVGNLSIRKEVNGGDNEFVITLARKIDDFGEDTEIAFNRRIKVYLQDEFNPAGDKLVAYGYIVSYKPYLQGKDEHVEVTCLSALSKLKNDFFRTGTSAVASELGVELTSKRADEMLEAIIDHYRSVESNSMLSNDYSNSDSTPDNSGNPITFDHRFFNMKHLDALREVSKFLPRNKDGGYFYYWRISTEGKLFVKNISTTADHTFTVGKHITSISGNKSIEGVVNRVYMWNEKGTVDPDYIKLTSDDITSQNAYDIMASYITDSKITNAAAASLLTSSRVYDKKNPSVKIKLELNGEYDLSSIVPGQTCQILNAKENTFKIGSDTVLFIHAVEYNVDTAVIEVSNAQENFEDIVEEERMRLDLEMRWYGHITQSLTAAQLSPANRVWTTTITFSATTGADAYRQIDWTAGIIYIPAGASGSAATRVVHIGNTGLMSPGSVYYIYLDEGTLPTASALVTRTGTSKQGGDILADDGSPGWSNDQYKGHVVEIGGQKKIIKSNTASVLTLEDRWTVADQTSQTFTISKLTLSVTDSEETAMSDTQIVFTNAAANTSADSEAILVPNAGIDLIVDGDTQIAKHSIVANNIVANTITAAEIAVGTITADRLNFVAFDASVDDLGDINDGGGYGKVLLTSITAGQIILAQCSGNLGDIGDGGGYGKVAATAISAGKIILTSAGVTGTLPTALTVAQCTNALADQTSVNTAAYISGQGALATADDLGDVSDGGGYSKILTTDIYAGHITLLERTVSLRQISLNASVPHIKVSYNGTDVIQMAVVGSEPKLEVYYSGNIKMRLTKQGLYWFDNNGNQRALLKGYYTSSVDEGLYCDIASAGGMFYCNQKIIAVDNINAISGGAFIAQNVANSRWIKLEHNNVNAKISSSYGAVMINAENHHFIPDDTDNNTHLGSSTYGWYDVWANDTSINASDLAEVEKVHPTYILTTTEIQKRIKAKYKIIKDDKIAKMKNETEKIIDSGLFCPGMKKKFKVNLNQKKIEAIQNDTMNEDFDIEKKRASKIELGSVVVISDDGCLPTNKKGQTNILGVVSTKPGIKLDSHAEGIFIAKVGKVPCRIIGQCQAGDLLQASNTEGCAEKSENPKTGSIIGRAKETKNTFEEEKIKIEVQMM